MFEKGKATFMVKFNAVVSCENGVMILEDKECGERWYFKNGICIKMPRKRSKENHG